MKQDYYLAPGTHFLYNGDLLEVVEYDRPYIQFRGNGNRYFFTLDELASIMFDMFGKEYVVHYIEKFERA